jgi:hypothetical protein
MPNPFDKPGAPTVSGKKPTVSLSVTPSQAVSGAEIGRDRSTHTRRAMSKVRGFPRRIRLKAKHKKCGVRSGDRDEPKQDVGSTRQSLDLPEEGGSRLSCVFTSGARTLCFLMDSGFIAELGGFTYKANIVWHKIRKDGGSDGRGFYFRNVN